MIQSKQMVQNKENLIHKILEYFFVFCLIINCQSMLANIPSFEKIRIITPICMFLIVFLLVFIEKEIQRKKLINAGVYALFLFAYFVAFIIIRPINMRLFLWNAMSATVILFYVLLNDKAINILYKYENCMIIIIIVSLFMWFFASILHIISPSGYVYTSWTGKQELLKVPNYFYLYYEPQTTSFLGMNIIRNCSIFTEAPMCSMSFTIGYMVELFCKRKPKLTRIVLFIIGILTTFSMTGYAIVVISLTAKYVLFGEKKSLAKIIRAVFIPISILIALYAVNHILNQRVGTGSGNARLDDFKAGFYAWKNSLLFGNGYSTMDIIKAHMSELRSNDMGFSNSPMLILAYGGIYLSMPYIFSFIRIFYKSIHKKRMICFYIFFLGIFIVTVIPFNYITFFLLALGATGSFQKPNSIIELLCKSND